MPTSDATDPGPQHQQQQPQQQREEPAEEQDPKTPTTTIMHQAAPASDITTLAESTTYASRQTLQEPTNVLPLSQQDTYENELNLTLNNSTANNQGQTSQKTGQNEQNNPDPTLANPGSDSDFNIQYGDKQPSTPTTKEAAQHTGQEEGNKDTNILYETEQLQADNQHLREADADAPPPTDHSNAKMPPMQNSSEEESAGFSTTAPTVAGELSDREEDSPHQEHNPDQKVPLLFEHARHETRKSIKPPQFIFTYD